MAEKRSVPLQKINILFVCLGNICRSPMAEGLFKKLVREKGLQEIIFCDSAGTSDYHIGEPPDKRMCETAEKYKIQLNHAGRQLTIGDFKHFNYILAMDGANYRNILKLSEKCNDKDCQVFMMREFDSIKSLPDVPDPYYGGMDGFDEVYRILLNAGEKFLNFLIKEHKLHESGNTF